MPTESLLKRKQSAQHLQKEDAQAAQNIEEAAGDMQWEEEGVYDESEDEHDITAKQSDTDSDTDLPLDTQEEEEDMPSDNLKVYLPGVALDPDMELVHDDSAYEMLHTLSVEWPCLSFDLLANKNNSSRGFPINCYLVAGSQAATASENKIYIMKMSQLSKTHNPDEDSDNDLASDDEEDNLDPILEYKSVPVTDSINRIRVMPHPDATITASHSSSGALQIYDLTQHVSALDTPGLSVPTTISPQFTQSLRQEGYALDWSPVAAARLVVGDNAGDIRFISSPGPCWTNETFLKSAHNGSVEDVKWSPTESSVFASCGSDSFLKIWDARSPKAAHSIAASSVDINVLSWSPLLPHLLATGSDSGSFKIWDLRSLPSPVPSAHFTWHKGPITSLSWHSHESSMIAVSGADEQLTIWDLALEADTETGAEMVGGVVVPPQLLFIHQGQSAIKELAWHGGVRGVVVSTGFDGFNLFKTINS